MPWCRATWCATSGPACRPAPIPGTGGIGIVVEADSTVSGNVVEGAPSAGIRLGYGPYLRDVSVTGNVVRNAGIGIGVSLVEGAGSAVIADNLISGARDGAIVGLAWEKPLTGDLLAPGARIDPRLTLNGNRAELDYFRVNVPSPSSSRYSMASVAGLPRLKVAAEIEPGGAFSLDGLNTKVSPSQWLSWKATPAGPSFEHQPAVLQRDVGIAIIGVGVGAGIGGESGGGRRIDRWRRADQPALRRQHPREQRRIGGEPIARHVADTARGRRSSWRAIPPPRSARHW